MSETVRGYNESPIGSHRWPIDPWQWPSVTVECGTQEVHFFLTNILLKLYARVVSSRVTEIGMVTHGDKHVRRWSATTPSQGAGPERYQKSWDLHSRHNRQILHGDQTKYEENWYWVWYDCFLRCLEQCYDHWIIGIVTDRSCISVHLYYQLI